MIHYFEPKKLTEIIPKKIETTTIILTIKIIKTMRTNLIAFFSGKTIERTRARIPHKPGGLRYRWAYGGAKGEVVYKFSKVPLKGSYYFFGGFLNNKVICPSLSGMVWFTRRRRDGPSSLCLIVVETL